MATGNEVLAVAAGELGVKESPANSDNVKYNDWYYGRGVRSTADVKYYWCMAFVQWCYDRAGAPLPYRTASCSALLNWYRKNDPACIVTEPRRGDIVLFDFNAAGAPGHTGLFESAAGGVVTSIDGNTGSTSEANGGAVMRRTRSEKYVAAYIRPRELEEEMKRYQTLEEIRADAPWAFETAEKLVARKALGGNGNGLDLSEDMLRMFVVNDRMGLYK